MIVKCVLCVLYLENQVSRWLVNLHSYSDFLYQRSPIWMTSLWKAGANVKQTIVINQRMVGGSRWKHNCASSTARNINYECLKHFFWAGQIIQCVRCFTLHTIDSVISPTLRKVPWVQTGVVTESRARITAGHIHKTKQRFIGYAMQVYS